MKHNKETTDKTKIQRANKTIGELDSSIGTRIPKLFKNIKSFFINNYKLGADHKYTKAYKNNQTTSTKCQ